MSGLTNAGRQRSASSVVKWSTADITCAILLLVISFTCTDTKDCQSCVYQNIEEVQRECRDILVKFEEAISEDNNVTAICKSLVHMYYCVGEHVPQCILNFTSLYQAYHQSPHDCHISREETTKLQQYRLNIKCNNSGVLSSLPSHTTAEMTSQTTADLSTSTSSTAGMRGVNSASRLETGGVLYVTTLTLLVTVWTLSVSVLT
ncbi:uncharacterized protein LOC110446481 isoform X2 [Mizuhopecten yessoensis]|uniref:uncharacterized protein LOC110446481 isoform X2 n=1 Tax=Mizuhopecten yessoensis TaxID=6573 RepID=UPI000B45DFFC|nr:uncharacterized protein LOC110446481 isoform X2 [Mizuhopecten yessoensis]